MLHQWLLFLYGAASVKRLMPKMQIWVLSIDIWISSLSEVHRFCPETLLFHTGSHFLWHSTISLLLKAMTLAEEVKRHWKRKRSGAHEKLLLNVNFVLAVTEFFLPERQAKVLATGVQYVSLLCPVWLLFSTHRLFFFLTDLSH